VNETSVNENTGRSISVIATRLPYIDRRSLSEAWFSALHLASDGPLALSAPERRDERPEHSVTNRQAAERRDGSLPDARTVPRPSGPSRALQPAGEPRAQAAFPTRSARALAASNRARSYAPFRTSLTLGVEGERVALLLRREGATLHVVALCRPAVADLVRRALVCADAHLRAGGEQIRARVETVPAGVVA
jgi:hypothetical protein